MSSKWYVVQAMSGHEKKVKRALEEGRENAGMTAAIEEIVVPTENVAEVKRGEQRVSEKRLWPGYVLVRMSLTDDAWQYIKNTNGVIGFLGGGKPTPLTDQEVGEILQEIQDKKEGVVQKHNIQVGDLVKIVDGVFVNFVGHVHRS